MFSYIKFKKKLRAHFRGNFKDTQKPRKQIGNTVYHFFLT